MKNENCKGCRFYEEYFHGFGVNMVYLSYRCTWTLKDPKDVRSEECHKAIKKEDE